MNEEGDMPEDVARMLNEARDTMLAEPPVKFPDPLEPPWVVCPEDGFGNMRWKMGSCEEYGMLFGGWFIELTETRLNEYVQQFPEPSGWDGFYERLIEQRAKRFQ